MRALVSLLVAVQGWIGLLLVSYGAWSVFHPAGFIVAGLGVLADLVVDELRGRERRPE